MNNRELSNKIIPVMPREVNSAYLNANPKGNSLCKTPNMSEKDSSNKVENLTNNNLEKNNICNNSNIFEKYDQNSRYVNENIKNIDYKQIEINNDFIPVIPRETNSAYLNANPKGNSYKTPEMEELKSLPKPRKRKLVLIKRGTSRPPQTGGKKAPVVVDLAKLQYVL